MNEASFQSLGLSPSILGALAEEGYEEPTPIQAAAIPSLLQGRDLLGTAQTGTGKTAAFALPIIQLLSKNKERPRALSCRALVVAPTRELAAQIDASFAAYGRRSGLSRACVFGGVGKMPQIKALAGGVDILIATPGRLLDLQGEGRLRLDRVEIVVLDEADRMLDMGFIRDVRRIFALLPRERQTLLFSATMPRDVEELASSILSEPARVAVDPERPTVDLIDQKIAHLPKAGKRAFLCELIRSAEVERAIVFTRTKHGADRLARFLSSSGLGAEAIHANKSQSARTKTLAGFRSGQLRVLVATDLAARGIDVDGITHVFNYELPNEPETYVHRIGRTARAGAAGSALALCDDDEKPLARAIERLLGQKIPEARGPIFASAYAAAEKAALAVTATEDSSASAAPKARLPAISKTTAPSSSRSVPRPGTTGQVPSSRRPGRRQSFSERAERDPRRGPDRFSSGPPGRGADRRARSA